VGVQIPLLAPPFLPKLFQVQNTELPEDLQRKSSAFQFCQCHAEAVHFSSMACQTILCEGSDYPLKTATTKLQAHGMQLAPSGMVQERHSYEKD
jgi:hypothetical protein